MITWTLKQTQMVFFKTVDCMFEISEFDLSDNTPQFYFREGQSYPDPYPKIEKITRFFIPESQQYKELPKAKNLFEAQANLIEVMIDRYCQLRLTKWLNGYYPMMLMREIGRQNLPLLINFFDEPNAVKSFSEVLKE